MVPYFRTHTRLEIELNALCDDVIRMSHRADKALEQSMQALKASNSDFAQQVIREDAEINHYRCHIEQTCYKLIALRQPTARDMRALMTAIHVAGELERMGDYALGIAKLSLRLEKGLVLKPIPEMLTMQRLTKDMLKASIDAYINWDVDLARATRQKDVEIDQLDKIASEKWIKLMQDQPHYIQNGTYLLWMTHNIERMADRLSSICERVVFMVTGEMQA